MEGLESSSMRRPSSHRLKGKSYFADMISVWRPVSPVEDWPLALCDGASMGYDDLIEVDLIRQDYIGSTMYAKYRRGYRWHYLESQTPDEVCLFKNFDSKDVRSQSKHI